MFDRKDFLAGVILLIIVLGTLAHRAGGIHAIVPDNRAVLLGDVILIIVCIGGGSALSFCFRGKLNPNYKASS